MRHYTLHTSLKYIFLFFVLIFAERLQSQSVVELIDRSDVAIAEGSYLDALNTLSDVLEQEHDNSKAHNLRGVAFEKLEQFENAVSCYQKAIKFDEGYAAPYFNLGLIFMGNGKEKEALGLFEKYILLKPKDASGWTQKGITYLYTEQVDSALFFLNRAIDLDKKNDRAFMYRGYTLSMMGINDRALEDLDKAVKLNPTSYNYFVRGDLKMELSDAKGAAQDYSAVLKMDPNLLGARLSRANAYLFSGQYEDCLNDVAGVLENEPANERALNYKAWAYFYTKDYQKCISVIEQAMQFNATQYNFNHLLGRCYLDSKDFAKAEKAFNGAIEQEPQRTDNYQLRAAAILRTNTMERELEKRGDLMVFRNINSNHTEQMTQWVKDAKHQYYYPKLLAKYNKDYQSLSYVEYFMFYFGFSEQADYAPYSQKIKQEVRAFDEYFEKQDYQGCVVDGEKFLKQHPFVIEAYLYVGSAYHKMGNFKKYGEYMFKYHALLESINMTGDGQSMESAYIITSPSDEYDLLYYLGFNSAEQSLLHENGHDYDVLSIKSEGGKSTSLIYFNIDKPYQTLSKEFEKSRKVIPANPSKKLNVKPGKG